MKRRLIVTAAVIRRPDGAVLLARRRPGGPDGGRWEFPGGKLEPGERAEECLRRELREELGIETTIGEAVAVGYAEHETFVVELHGFLVQIVAGEPHPHEHDTLTWVQPAAFDQYDLPIADLPIAQALRSDRKH